jgi:hypothetical protein
MFNNLKKPSNNISSSENVSGSENGDTEANTSSAKLYRVKSSEKLSVGEKYLKDSSYSNNNSKPKYALD